MRDGVPSQQPPTAVPHDDERQPKIAIKRLGKRFATAQQDAWALQDVTFSVCNGEFIALVGESGCGKTTLLRLIAGLETPTNGTIQLNGQAVRGPSQEVGIVFQRPVLLPWRTVLDNVLLPVELTRQSRGAARQHALDLLRLFNLQAFAGHRPEHLSGGMQQRVALARTLMLQPSVLLMDEPFGALDAITREQLNLELLRMWRQGQETVVFITHDIAEAVFLADRVLVMSRRPGRIAATFKIPLSRPRELDMRFEILFATLCRDIHRAMGLMHQQAST
jgi:NitT/TauT family transport system ATP-binding protein